MLVHWHNIPVPIFASFQFILHRASGKIFKTLNKITSIPYKNSLGLLSHSFQKKVPTSYLGLPSPTLSSTHITNLIFLFFQCAHHIGILSALQMFFLLALPSVYNVVLPNLEILSYSLSGLVQVSIFMVAIFIILSREALHSHPQHSLCVSFIGLTLISNDYTYVFTLYICLNVRNLRSKSDWLCSTQCPS